MDVSLFYLKLLKNIHQFYYPIIDFNYPFYIQFGWNQYKDFYWKIHAEFYMQINEELTMNNNFIITFSDGSVDYSAQQKIPHFPFFYNSFINAL